MDRSDPDRHLTLHARVEGLHLLGLGYHLTDGFHRAGIALVAHFGQDLLGRLQTRLELTLLDEQGVDFRFCLFAHLSVPLDLLFGALGVRLELIVNLLEAGSNRLDVFFQSHDGYSLRNRLVIDAATAAASLSAAESFTPRSVASRSPLPAASRWLALNSEISFFAASADIPDARSADSRRRMATADAFSPFSAT